MFQYSDVRSNRPTIRPEKIRSVIKICFFQVEKTNIRFVYFSCSKELRKNYLFFQCSGDVALPKHWKNTEML